MISFMPPPLHTTFPQKELFKLFSLILIPVWKGSIFYQEKCRNGKSKVEFTSPINRTANLLGRLHIDRSCDRAQRDRVNCYEYNYKICPINPLST